MPCRPTCLGSGPGMACYSRLGQLGPASLRAGPCLGRAKKMGLGLGRQARAAWPTMVLGRHGDEVSQIEYKFVSLGSLEKASCSYCSMSHSGPNNLAGRDNWRHLDTMVHRRRQSEVVRKEIHSSRSKEIQVSRRARLHFKLL